NHDPFFAELDGGLAIAVQPVRRRVAAEQGSEGDPELDPERAGGWFIQGSRVPSGAKAPEFLLPSAAQLKPCPFKTRFRRAMSAPVYNLFVARLKPCSFKTRVRLTDPWFPFHQALVHLAVVP